MTDLITQNPIVAFVLAIVSVAAVMWKIFHALYVKPRDFRIDMLKEDMARLRGQLEDLKGATPGTTPGTSVTTAPGHAGAASAGAPPHPSTALESRSRPSELPTRPEAEQPPADLQVPEGSSRPTGEPGQSSKSPADSLSALYEQWSDPSMTKLQKQKFEQDWIGKDVRWSVSTESVGEASHGRIFVGARDGAKEGFAAARSILVCSERHADVLLSLRPGDQIVVTGKIREFFIIPSVDVSAIERP
jgi:hypothetical protein